MKWKFRRYSKGDRRACLKVFDSNVPKFFRDHERDDFATFIDASECPYFVIEESEQIVGCGGYGIREGSDLADLCWGMVAQGSHRRGFGEVLLLGRLYEILKEEDVRGVRLLTSQLTEGFFKRYGFRVERRQRDAIAAGLDEIRMLLEFSQASREWITARWQNDRKTAPRPVSIS